MSIEKNDDIVLKIDGCSSEGEGIGHSDGLAVFVPGSAEGDTVLCHIIKVKKNYAIGRIGAIKEPSADRIKPDCSAFPRCGGCAFRHISYEAEARKKEQTVRDAFMRIGHLDNVVIEPIIAADNRNGVRNKAQYPIGATPDGKLFAGFYAARSHRVIKTDFCPMQPEVFSDICGICLRHFEKHHLTAYDEESGRGLLRHLYIRRAEQTGEIMVCPVINGDSIAHPEELIKELSAVAGFKTLVLNINKEQTNVILGGKVINIYGDGYITDELCGIKVRISPLSFYQVNHCQCEKLYSKAAEYASLGDGCTVLDLYCGAGTIGLSMAKKAKLLIGVEIVPEAIEDAKENAALNNAENARFICADAAEAAGELDREGIKPDVILLDPPRKGCEKSLLETAAKMNPQKIVYVSCDPATLARDAAGLERLGYKAERATPVDMFPGTAHVETIVLMSRVKE